MFFLSGGGAILNCTLLYSYFTADHSIVAFSIFVLYISDNLLSLLLVLISANLGI